MFFNYEEPRLFGALAGEGALARARALLADSAGGDFRGTLGALARAIAVANRARSDSFSALAALAGAGAVADSAGGSRRAGLAAAGAVANRAHAALVRAARLCAVRAALAVRIFVAAGGCAICTALGFIHRAG